MERFTLENAGEVGEGEEALVREAAALRLGVVLKDGWDEAARSGPLWIFHDRVRVAYLAALGPEAH